jgi:hypothetical protein
MTLRIISEASARNLERGLHTGRDIGGSLQDTYTTRLAKLVPAEALTAYPMFLNYYPPEQRTLNYILGVAAIILLVVIVLRWSATKGPDGKAQWAAIILSAISFVIYVFVLSSATDFAALADVARYSPLPMPLLSSLVLFAWTAIAPSIYTGDSL